jgi:uncharacterized protein (DUF58 family)
MLSSRGSFVAFGGIILTAVGLAIKGVQSLGSLIYAVFAGFLSMGEGIPDDMQELIDLINTIFGSGTEVLPDYLMFLGMMMIIASMVGLPLFRFRANASVLRITRTLDREKAFAGEFVHVSVRIQNISRKSLDFVEVYDAIPETFELSIGENYIVTELPGRQIKEFSYIVRVPTRGVYRIGPMKAIIHDKLGFYYEEDSREFFTEILVYPSYEDVRRMDALSKKRQIGKMFGSHKTREKGMGDDFHSLRKYFPGDEFKKLDWKAFSRTGELMVREFESEKNIRMIIFLDTSASMGGGIPNNTKLDFGIRATMLAKHLADERGDISGIITFADRPTSWLPPGRRGNQYFQMLEVLALVEPKGRSNPLAAVDYVLRHLPRSSFYVFITDLETANIDDFREAASRAVAAGNRIIIISPLGPLFEATSELSPVERALAEAISEEYLGHRKQVEDALRSLGVEILNVGPEDMLAEVIRQYHKAKAQGKGVV